MTTESSENAEATPPEKNEDKRSRDKDDDDDSTSWSKRLISPCPDSSSNKHDNMTLSLFSPSLPDNNNASNSRRDLEALLRNMAVGGSVPPTASFHGIGLTMAMHRLHDLRLIHGRLEDMIRAVMTCYQTFGRDILVHTWSEKDGDHSEMRVWQQLALDYYHCFADPSSSDVNKENQTKEQTLYQQYRDERSECQRLRKQALSAQTEHVQLVQRIREYTVVKWAQEMSSVEQDKAENKKDTEGTKDDDEWKISSDAPPFEQALWKYMEATTMSKENGSDDQTAPRKWTHTLVQELKQVQKHQETYQELVDQEHGRIEQAIRKEKKALDGLEPLERAGVVELAQVVCKRLVPLSTTTTTIEETNEKGSSFINIPQELKRRVLIQKRTAASTASATRGGSGSTASSLDDDFAKLEKKSKEVFANLFETNKSSVGSYEEGSAKKEAQTFGFPEEVANLRERVKKKVTLMEKTIGNVKQLSILLDGLYRACMQLAQSLGQALVVPAMGSSKRQQPNKTSLEALTTVAVGPKCGDFWEKFQMTIQTEIALVQALANTINHLKTSKLGHFLESVEKDLKLENETDDSNWKQLCQAASNESKALAKERQSKSNLTKAKSSMDDQHKRDGSGANGLGDAMKRFGNNAKQAIAKGMLQDAESNANKHRLAVEESKGLKKRALAEYTKVTGARIEKFDTIAQNRKDSMENILKTIQTQATELAEKRKTSLTELIEDTASQTAVAHTTDMEKWLGDVVDKVHGATEAASQSPASANAVGFKMTFVPTNSTEIDQILALDLDVVNNISGLVEDCCSRTAKQPKLEANQTRTKERSSPVPSASNRIRTFSDASASRVPRIPKSPFRTAATASSTGTSEASSEAVDIKAFNLAFFKGDDQDATVEPLRMIPCSYRPKEKGNFLIQNVAGRVFTTKAKLYFLSWAGKSVEVEWSDVISTSKEKSGFMGKNNEDSIVVSYKSNAGNEAAFVLNAVEKRDGSITHFQELIDQARNTATEKGGPASSVPRDLKLKDMMVVLDKTLKNVSVKRVYEKIWSEGMKTNEKPFYGPWLVDEDCFDIEVKDWDFGECVNPWDGQTYDQQRLCTFRFKRKTHLYIGPPVAYVKQMHYCRTEKNDKCVVAISASFQGVPYADCFAVEMRWVGRREGENDLQIEMGLFVDFQKKTMLKSQIQAGTIAETKNVHTRLFKAVKATCGVEGTSDVGDDEVEESPQVEDSGGNILNRFSSVISRDYRIVMVVPLVVLTFFAFRRSGAPMSSSEAAVLSSRIDELHHDVKDLKRSVDLMVSLLQKKS